MPLAPPRTDQPHYGEHLGDAGYWGPYVMAALADAGLPRAELETPFVGTCPTFLVGEVVVKLFGETFDGGAAFAAERTMGELLAGVPEIPAPAVVASGRLFDGSAGWAWPYLIMERLHARAARDLPSPRPLRRVAAQLGPALARLHTLPAPATITARDPLPALRVSAPDRLRGFGLPAQLVEQVPDFLADASAERVLVHADVTADHVFVDDDGLAGIIDWADATPPTPGTSSSRSASTPSAATPTCSRSSSTATGGRRRMTSESVPCKGCWSSSSTRSPRSPAWSTCRGCVTWPSSPIGCTAASVDHGPPRTIVQDRERTVALTSPA